MRSYSQLELRTFVRERLEPLRGARLQEVLCSDRGLALGFWKQGLFWLVIDLSPNDPIALLFIKECPFRKGLRSKPVALFLKAHGLDHVLTRVEIAERWGRVLILRLEGGGPPCEVEVQLIPKQANLLVRAGEKQVAWEKPKTLVERELMTSFPSERSLDEIHHIWKSSEASSVVISALDPAQQWLKKKDRDLEKKQKAQIELAKQVASKEAEDWFERGEALKRGEGELIDERKTRAWNIEEAFARAKRLEIKRSGAERRWQILCGEIEELRQVTYEDHLKKVSAAKPQNGAPQALLGASKAKGRTLRLSESLSAYIGKSAADNLALLRRAKAWDYWLHLKDEPGAHAILQRLKNQVVSDEDFRQVARWLIKESVKRSPMAGDKIAIIIAECRHVRPIKGDRLGRVTYYEGRTLELRW